MSGIAISVCHAPQPTAYAPGTTIDDNDEPNTEHAVVLGDPDDLSVTLEGPREEIRDFLCWALRSLDDLPRCPSANNPTVEGLDPVTAGLDALGFSYEVHDVNGDYVMCWIDLPNRYRLGVTESDCSNIAGRFDVGLYRVDDGAEDRFSSEAHRNSWEAVTAAEVLKMARPDNPAAWGYDVLTEALTAAGSRAEMYEADEVDGAAVYHMRAVELGDHVHIGVRPNGDRWRAVEIWTDEDGADHEQRVIGERMTVAEVAALAAQHLAKK